MQVLLYIKMTNTSRSFGKFMINLKIWKILTKNDKTVEIYKYV